MSESIPLSASLGVLATTKRVIDLANAVHIDPVAIDALALRIAQHDLTPAVWQHDLHWHGEPNQTANYMLVLDALNFCFWGEPRWTVEYRGQRYNGYAALAASLTHTLEHDIRLTDATYLAQIDEAQLTEIFAGEGQIPLLSARAEHLREVGRVLQARYDGQFANLMRAADGSAVEFVRLVVDAFPSFRDVAIYAGFEVHFYKRAQILASDLHGAFDGRGLGAFRDLEQLTAFADYKVPQVLRELGVLRYAPELSALVDAQIELEAGSPFEVEIRAATIWAVEALRQALARLDIDLPAYQLDWTLWQFGQNLPAATRPYHRTRTIFY